MPDIDHLIEVCESYRVQVQAIVTPEITELALDIAYYSAMIDAAKDDPIEDDEEQKAVLEYFQTHLTESIERYQSLVNDQLP